MNGVIYKKNFYIKQHSTLPEIKYPLTQELREKFDISDEMLTSVAVTFSMIDIDTGIYKIANVPANLVINDDRVNYPDEQKYTLTYRFNEIQTNKSGNYSAEFVVDFIGYSNCGKIKLPVNGYLNIVITDSITKTTVI